MLEQIAPEQYVLRFTAKVSWDGQANGLPPHLFAFVLVSGYDAQVFSKIVEDQAGAFIRMQAFCCQKDQGQVIDLHQNPQERMIVPFRWIVNISADVTKLVGELSHADEEGVERYEDGKEPVKQ
jgi:hypothetical protein